MEQVTFLRSTKHGNQCLFTFTYAHKAFRSVPTACSSQRSRSVSRAVGPWGGDGGPGGQSPPKIFTGIEVKTFPSKDLEILLTPLPGFSDLPTVLIDESHKKFISTTRYIFVSSHCLFFILQELEAKLEDMLQEKVPPTDEEFEV